MLDISKLKETEEEIRQLNLKLEARVHERTIELAHTNEQLAAEIQEREKVGIALAAFSPRAEAALGTNGKGSRENCRPDCEIAHPP